MGRLSGKKKRGVQLKVTERGWPELMNEFKSLQGYGRVDAAAGVVELGIGQEVQHKSDLSNVEIAVIQEYGAGNVPERSFMRSTYDKNFVKYDEMTSDLAKKVYDRKIHLEEACARLARRMALDIKATILGGIPPPLAPDTLARRRGTVEYTSEGEAVGTPASEIPLVDKGYLLESIVGIVMKGVGGSAIRQRIEARVEQMGGGVE